MLDADDDRLMPASVLAERLQMSRSWVSKQAKDLGIKTKPLPSRNGPDMLCYPVGTLTILRGVLERRREELALPALMSIQEMADALGKSYGWTAQAVKRHGFKVGKYEQRRAFRTALYGRKRVLGALRDEVQAQGVAENGYNLSQLVDITGFDRDWIDNRFTEADIGPELRWSPLTGKVLGFYDESVVEFLNSIPSYPPAGNWLVADAIQKDIGKSTNWTRARLAKPDVQAMAEIRLDPHLVPRLHFPPQVVEILEKEIVEARKYPKAGDWLLVYQIAKQLGRSKLWVDNRLKFLGIQGELRRDGKGRVKEHFPPDIGVRLLSEAPDDMRYK